MGYITYSIHYGRGEVWSETRPFFDFADMQRLTSMEFTTAIAEEYKAELVYVTSININGREIDLVNIGEMRAV